MSEDTHFLLSCFVYLTFFCFVFFCSKDTVSTTFVHSPNYFRRPPPLHTTFALHFTSYMPLLLVSGGIRGDERIWGVHRPGFMEGQNWSIVIFLGYGYCPEKFVCYSPDSAYNKRQKVFSSHNFESASEENLWKCGFGKPSLGRLGPGGRRGGVLCKKRTEPGKRKPKFAIQMQFFYR